MSREPKDERFIRLAEARVNKIIKMVRLLGNLSGSSNYTYTQRQVEQIYTALQTELDKSRKRFAAGGKYTKPRFTLSDSPEKPTTPEWYPTIVLPLPDGRTSVRRPSMTRTSQRLTSIGIKAVPMIRST